MFRAIRSDGRPIGRMTGKPEVIVKLALTGIRPGDSRGRLSPQELDDPYKN